MYSRGITGEDRVASDVVSGCQYLTIEEQYCHSYAVRETNRYEE